MDMQEYTNNDEFSDQFWELVISEEEKSHMIYFDLLDAVSGFRKDVGSLYEREHNYLKNGEDGIRKGVKKRYNDTKKKITNTKNKIKKGANAVKNVAKKTYAAAKEAWDKLKGTFIIVYIIVTGKGTVTRVKKITAENQAEAREKFLGWKKTKKDRITLKSIHEGQSYYKIDGNELVPRRDMTKS